MDASRYSFCPVCGQRFFVRHPMQKYCSHDCYRTHLREYNREYQRALRDNDRGVRLCKQCGKPIRKAGRSKYCSSKCARGAQLAYARRYYYEVVRPAKMTQGGDG